MKRKTIDEYKFLVKFYMENIELMPGQLVKKAKKVDLIRNNFAKTVIYNYFLHTKRALKDGHRCKGFPEKMYEMVLNYQKKHLEPEVKVTSKYIEKWTLDDIIKQTYEDFEKIKEKYNKIMLENDKKMATLREINEEIKNCLELKIEEFKQKRSNLIKEYLEKGEE